MAKKISELTALTSVATDDYFPVVDTSTNTTKKVSGANMLPDNSVTPSKRTGGYKVGNFTAPSSTGNYAVTGVGFTPKKVSFRIVISGTENSYTHLFSGSMDSAGNQFCGGTISTSTIQRTRSSTSACILGYYNSGGSFTQDLVGVFVSMNADGFTVNFTSANSRYLVLWEAEA